MLAPVKTREANKRQRHHRVRRAPLDHDEEGEEHDAGDDGGDGDGAARTGRLESRSARRSARRSRASRALAPSQSTGPRAFSSRLSGTFRTVSQSATAASGRLIQKATRQDSASIRKPPIGGPSDVVIADAAAQVPIARPRTSLREIGGDDARGSAARAAPRRRPGRPGRRSARRPSARARRRPRRG